MSWSITATGEDAESTMQAFTEALRSDKTGHCPPDMAQAIIKAAVHLMEPMPEQVHQVTTNGHIGADKKGYVNLSISLS